MVEYPSNAIEISRDVLNTRKEFPSLYILSDLSKRGLSLRKKLSLIQGYHLKEENLLDVVLQTKKEFIKGEKCLTEDQLRLGVGPDGRYRHEEFLVGMVLEEIIDKKMYKYTQWHRRCTELLLPEMSYRIRCARGWPHYGFAMRDNVSYPFPPICEHTVRVCAESGSYPGRPDPFNERYPSILYAFHPNVTPFSNDKLEI